jgi:predicted amidohydrolase
MKRKRILLGMGQLLVEGGKVNQNLTRAVEMINEAAKKGCKLIVLPECLDVGWTHPDARKLGQPIPGKHSDVLCRSARKSNIYIAAGLTEKVRDIVYNSAVLISPDGEILLKHRKINILKIAQDIYATGDSLSVAGTSFGVVGMNICADNFPDSLVLGHSLARMGAQILISPSSWAVEAKHDNKKKPYGSQWRKSYKTLAGLYDIPVFGVSNVGWINAGVWKGRRCIGCSLAVGAGGKILAQGPYGESAECLVEVSVQPKPTCLKKI